MTLEIGLYASSFGILIDSICNCKVQCLSVCLIHASQLIYSFSTSGNHSGLTHDATAFIGCSPNQVKSTVILLADLNIGVNNSIACVNWRVLRNKFCSWRYAIFTPRHEVQFSM